jgi:hypothetical protein
MGLVANGTLPRVHACHRNATGLAYSRHILMGLFGVFASIPPGSFVGKYVNTLFHMALGRAMLSVLVGKEEESVSVVTQL